MSADLGWTPGTMAGLQKDHFRALAEGSPTSWDGEQRAAGGNLPCL